MATVDVTVRGAGIFGLSVAWACLTRGARVRVIDPGGVAAGASGGVVGALAPHAPDAWTPMKAFQLDGLLMAGPFWTAVEAVSGISAGFARTGRLQSLSDGIAVDRARDREADAERNWKGAATWRVNSVADKLGDWTPVSASGFLVHDSLSARITPRRACESLASAIRSRGGDIAMDAPNAGTVVWATGWQGLQALSGALGAKVGDGVKGQALLLRQKAPPDAPQILSGGLHIVPHADGTVAVGSTTEQEFETPSETDAQLDDLLDRAVAALPILHGAEVVHRWAGVRPRAKTRSPMLGAWPGRPGHFVANGGFKIGFGVAPKVAAIIADLVLDDRDAIPEGFRVEDNL